MRLLDWSSLQAYLIWAYVGLPGGSGIIQNQDDFRAWLLRKGQVRVTVGRQNTVATVGQWIIPAHGTLHYEFSPDARVISIRFRAAWPDGQHLIDARSHTLLDARRFPALETTAKAMARIVSTLFPATGSRLLRECTDYHTYLGLQRGMTDWLEALISALEPSDKLVFPPVQVVDDRVLAAAQCMDRLPLDQEQPISMAAESAGLSLSQLDRLFARHLRLTPRRYFDQRRLRHASDILEHTNRPIKELAYELGFCHPSAFTVWFQKQKGFTPRAYRIRLKARHPAAEPAG